MPDVAALSGAITSPIREVVNVLRRRASTVITTIVVLTAAATLGGFLLPAKYTATVTIMIDSRQTRIVDVEQVLADLPGGQEMLDTELGLIRSRTLAVRVMHELSLFDDLEPDRARHSSETVASGRSPAPGNWLSGVGGLLLASTQTVTDRVADVWRGGAWSPEPLPIRETQHNREIMIDEFLEDLQVNQAGGAYSRLLSISFSAPDPAMAAAVANRVATIYAESQLEEKRAATRRANDWLNGRLRDMQEEVLAAERDVARFRAENELTEVRGSALGGEELAELNRESIQVRSELAAKKSKMRLIGDLRVSARDLGSLTDVMDSPLIETLRKDEAELERQQGELAAQYGERHPRMLAFLEAKTKIAQRIKEETNRIVLSLEDDLAVTESRLKSIERGLALSRTAFVAQNQAEIRLRELDREAAAKRDLYRTLLARYQETKTQEGLLVPDARVVSAAGVPLQPSTPSPLVLGVVGFTLSVVAGGMLALMREHLDDRARSSRQLESLFDLPALGLLPRIARRNGESLSAYLSCKPCSHYAEAIYSLHRSAFASSGDQLTKVVLVTSALPYEGKTSLAASLAAGSAKLGKKTILIDLDLRRPSIAREFRLAPALGVADYIVGEDRLDAIIIRDQATGLDILPAKRHQRSATEILMSPRLHQLLELLRCRYDCIVLDAPPVLGLIDTKLLANYADATLFLVRWGKTKLSAVASSLHDLRQVDAKLRGVVLGQIHMRKYARAHYGDAAEHHETYRRYYLN